jgi:FkbM family methyltransferase
MARLQQALHLLRVLPRPGALAALRRWRPFSTTAFEMLAALRREAPGLRTIVDGGANVGQFARAALETYPDARLYCFEPLPDVAGTLRHNLSDTPRATVFAAALGPEAGEATFHRTAYSLRSSLLRPTDVAAEALRVPVVRLDDALAGLSLDAPLLVKLDLQGYELEALRGAPETLARAQFVLLETAFRADYEGEPLFDEVSAFMRAAGFHLRAPLDVLRADGRIVQMDALFARD